MPQLGGAVVAFGAGVVCVGASRQAAVAMLCVSFVWMLGSSRAGRKRGAALALLACFFAAGALRMRATLAIAADPRLSAPVVATLEGRVWRRGAGWVDLASVRGVRPSAALPHRVRVRVPATAPAVLGAAARGDLLRLRARVVPAAPQRNPGGRDLHRVLARRGIAAQAWLVVPPRVVRVHPHPPRGRLLRVAGAARRNAAEQLGARGSGGALLAALAFGARVELGEQREAFRSLGLSHLLAISGLHLALVGLGSYRLGLRALLVTSLRPRDDPRRGALLLSCVVTGAYALLAGGAVPVRRAWIMWLAFAATWWLRRPVRARAGLAAAAAVVLVTDPATLFDVGAQLSFTACFALSLGAEASRDRDSGGQRRALSRLRTALSSGLRGSAEAIAATAPIAAAGVGVLSPWALVANAVAVPWTALVLLPSALVAGVALLLPDPLGGALIEACARVAEASVSAVAWGARRVPPALRCDPSGAALLAAAGLAFSVVRARRPIWKGLGAAAMPPLLAFWPAAPQLPPPPRAIFFDVGQGDAALVQGENAALLFDAGGIRPGGAGQGAYTVLPALAALGVRRLDVVVASHRDLDHRGGIARVLAEVAVGELWLPWGARDDPAFGELLEVAARRGVPVAERGRGSPPLIRGELRITPLWPPRLWRGSSNDRSLVVRVDPIGRAAAHGRGREASLLFAGDIETAAERALLADRAALRAAVLKLPHHGSRSSSSRRFLAAVAPRVAIASAARHHRFGMPHPEVRARVGVADASLWHTGRDGAVWVGMGPRLWVRAQGRSVETQHVPREP